MTKSKIIGNIYVSITDKVVTVIETIGEYDNIIRREFDTQKDAEEYYKAQGG